MDTALDQPCGVECMARNWVHAWASGRQVGLTVRTAKRSSENDMTLDEVMGTGPRLMTAAFLYFSLFEITQGGPYCVFTYLFSFISPQQPLRLDACIDAEEQCPISDRLSEDPHKHPPILVV